ncbi:MAG TPA: sialate O-acetylesterase [Planctomycetota bacterium]|nr:sialate O-acetylesterase [Planctomycetota bacterium]
MDCSARWIVTARAAALLAASIATTAAACAPPGRVKVFVLAGQSNMEGKAKVELLERQLSQPATRSRFERYQKEGRWVERDDVFIKFLDRKGALTVGFGSPGCIGPELELGHVLGDRFEEPVLLIKTAWGGRSLFRDFRPPSAGLPAPAALEKLLAAARKQKPDATLADVKAAFGASYGAMIEEVKSTLAKLGEHFPQLAGREPEIAGFVWFQGWNDMIDAEATAEYTSNLARFIRDVRKDLASPALPFVVGQMGVEGLKPSAEIQRFKAAQAAILDVPDLKANVALVKTDVFWDVEAEAVFKKGWREHIDEWNAVGSDWPFHYLGSVKTMCAIGKAFAEALLAPPRSEARG